MESTNVIQSLTDKPLFDPTYLNIEYVFYKISSFVDPVIAAVTNPHTWQVIGMISASISLLSIVIILFSIIRMYEIQMFDKDEINHEIKHALEKDKEKERVMNPRWKYVLTLVESPNESDWRIAIMEADSLLEESLKERDLVGNSMAELLEEAKFNGYPNIQSAWDAHLIRNKIAHEGQDYSVTQVEARRVIKLYQNVFEGIGVIQ